MEEAAFQRATFLMNFLYYVGPRISEVVNSSMSSFRKVDDRWWWYTRGKGGVERKVPLAKPMVKALRLYRVSLNLPAEPAIEETTPLLFRLYGTGIPLSSCRTVHQVVKEIFRQAWALTDDEASRKKLEQASCHWMRHTFATRMHQVGIDDATRQSTLGHVNRTTTEIYTHFEDRKIHEEFDKL
jgi:site-specific recombinase XerD